MRILGMGIQELLAILVICVLIFGVRRLPEIGRSIGKSMQELKKSLKEDNSEDQQPPETPSDS